mgnify:CR=1
MQSQVQRRRLQGVLRPRQPRNDVNTGALVPANDPEDALRGADRDEFSRRCAERDLI